MHDNKLVDSQPLARAPAAFPERGPERSGGPTGGEAAGARGRPGRRSAAERRDAVLQVLSGKASVDQVAHRLGVRPETVEAWRDLAVRGIEGVLAAGDTGSARERELEREVRDLRDALADVSVKYAVAKKGIEEWKRTARPSKPARSRR